MDPEYEVETEVVHVHSQHAPVAVLVRLIETQETTKPFGTGTITETRREIIDSWKHEVQVRR
jgi:hypothetical protein